jgi:alpha-N-arabinofuranosidase
MDRNRFSHPKRLLSGVAICLTIALAWSHVLGAEPGVTLSIQLDEKGKAISPDLFGIFFEDLNYAADGGLYAELIQNGSFEYSATDSPDWTSLSFWQLVTTRGAKGALMIQDAAPLNANNPNYAVLRCDNPGKDGEVGISNGGFDGIAVKAGEACDFSVFARRRPNEKGPVRVRLTSADGRVLTQADLPELTIDWAKYTVSLVPSRTEQNARLVLSTSTRGMVFLDMVSLFPHKTFHDRPNGLRADLAQMIADLKPRFVRFPGGCLAHGDGIKNIYRWKDTIGPVEQRKQQKNIWRYHQSFGLGYFEYFQFCEDIGATPVPVVAAGVSCQNSDLARGTGQQCISMDQMSAYVHDILDLIEYANAPATSPWGAKRAAAGHPEPFKLKYLGIGNEDAMTPGFQERFTMLFDAVRAKHPEITVIGTVGPSPSGHDFEEGWKLANALAVPIVDEHYYMPPDWFLKNLTRYDNYNRDKSKVYLGEYASRDNTLRNALAEATYMTSLERNGDVVHMASYAPLLGKLGHTQWNPDLIYFTNTRVNPTVNYYVQQMFSCNQGDSYLSIDVGAANAQLATSCVRDSRNGDVILKLVNLDDQPQSTRVELSAANHLSGTATKTVLAGDLTAINKLDSDKPLVPNVSTMTVSSSFEYPAPAHSLTVIRMKSKP